MQFSRTGERNKITGTGRVMHHSLPRFNSSLLKILK